MTQILGYFPFIGCQVTLEIRETAAGNFPFGKEENSRQIRKKQPFLYIVMVRVYHRRFGVLESNCKFMCYAIPFHISLFVYLIDPEARTYTV